MEVFESLRSNLVGKNVRIVLPEGKEPRILQATKRLVKETDVIPVLLGKPEKLKFTLKSKEFMRVMKSSTLTTTLSLTKWLLRSLNVETVRYQKKKLLDSYVKTLTTLV